MILKQKYVSSKRDFYLRNKRLRFRPTIFVPRSLQKGE